MNVLIADDDPIPRRLLEASLTRAGHAVQTARDGAEAWDKLQQDDAPRLAILDWLMPGLDGPEVCRRVRARADGPYVYLILLTSKNQQEDIVAGMDSGADDYLTKPFDPHELRVRVHAGRRILDLQADLLHSLDKLAEVSRREAEVGAKIQQTLLLGQPPQTLDGARIAALTIPSQTIDGDFYDFYKHSETCVDVIVGDVMGKGIPAALLGAALKGHFPRALGQLLYRSGHGALPEPEAIVSVVHQEVTGQFIGLDSFETLCYARFDFERREVVFVDCGHTATIHFRRDANACETMQGDNMPLGFSEREVYTQAARSFGPGDVFFFYSDGVTEAQNAEGEQFGVERLSLLVAAHHHLGPAELIARVHKEVVAFSGSESFPDDLTCVALTVADAPDDAPLAQASRAVSSTLDELVPIRAFVRAFCLALPPPVLDDDWLALWELAVVEAASNIMRHALTGRPDHTIALDLCAFADRLELRLRHAGGDFDPGSVPPPDFEGAREGGFGVYIIAESVDHVTYSREESGEQCVFLMKKRP